jgi:hypothetical protein
MSRPKKIVFIPQVRPTAQGAKLEPPKPAKSYIPQWYKDGELWLGGSLNVEGYSSNTGMKHCIPFLDSLTTGYMIETPCDIQVVRDKTKELPRITWMLKPDPLELRSPNLGSTIPKPAGYDNTNWAWVGTFGIKLPSGYSLLLTHPLNRFDLPFITLSGVMDSDGHYPAGRIPFVLRSDFEGVIPAGTPIAQVIPFKRENWSHEVNYDEDIAWESSQQNYNARRVVSGYYKKNVWKRKSYE